jgi:hypothetical protein
MSFKFGIDGHHMVNDMFDHAIIWARVNHQPPADQEGWTLGGQEKQFSIGVFHSSSLANLGVYSVSVFTTYLLTTL